MNPLAKILSWLRIESHPGGINITLIEEPREGGYTLIYSPELKGFALMLDQSQTKGFSEFSNAIEQPLLTYLDAYYTAKHEAERTKRLRLTGLNETRPMQYRAQLCTV
jgi:hypothetical protein